jgi:hypothetical protein
MGIHGLSYFIKSSPSLVKNVEWKLDSAISDQQDHFIIDGNAFVYHIAFENRTNWTHGGQYATIAQVVRATVAALVKANIQLTFLFDGSLPQDKIETRIKRNKSYIERSVSTFWNLKQINTSNKNVEQRDNGIQYYGDLFLIPPLTLEVIVQTLRELDVVDVKICQGEADGEVVTMAIEKNGYVVSQDSDMHVYPNIGKGYIPLESLNIPLQQNEDQKEGGGDAIISAGVFHPEALASLLNLKLSLLPLFGTLLGNDYLDADLVRFPIGQWCSVEGIQMMKNQSGWPKVVAEFIRRNCTEEQDAIRNVVDQLKPIISKSNMKSREEKASGFQDRIFDSISRYDANSPLLSTALLNNVGDDDQESRTMNIILGNLKHHSNGLSRQVMDVIKSKTFWTSIFVEDIEREFSWDVSRSLRQGLYGSISELLKSQHQQRNQKDKVKEDEDSTPIMIEEYVREKQHLEVVPVAGGIINRDNQINLSDKEKLEDFCRFHISNETKHLSTINSNVHPLILCMRYMIYHCSQSTENGKLCNHEVVAIIIATLRSLAPVIGYTEDEVPIPTIGTPALKKRSIHLSAQYQSIIYSSYLLSQILDIPDYLHQANILSHMYNGLYFHYYIEIARCGASIGKLLYGVSPKFTTLFCTVYKSVISDLNNDVEDIFDYEIISTAIKEWTISDQKPKRLNSTQKSSNRPEKKKKSSKATNGNNKNRSTNAFNVLSFGCNFDDE